MKYSGINGFMDEVQLH